MSECRVRVGAVLPADYSPGVMQRNGCAPCPTNRSSKIAAPAQSLGRRQWAPRYLHRACAMPNSRFVVIFGGQGDNQTFFNDIRVVDVREPAERRLDLLLGRAGTHAEVTVRVAHLHMGSTRDAPRARQWGRSERRVQCRKKWAHFFDENRLSF